MSDRAARRFEATFRGRLGPALVSEFEGLSVSYCDTTTTVSGVTPDRAALEGMLAGIFNLGLDLVSLHVTSHVTGDEAG